MEPHAWLLAMLGPRSSCLWGSGTWGLCYEAATDVCERSFPWTEEGVAQLKAWMQSAYDTFAETGKVPAPIKEEEDA